MTIFRVIFLAVAGIALLPILGGGAYGAEMVHGAQITKPTTRVEAPSFTLNNLDSGVVSLADYKGKVVLIHFWATWCAPCREEMPELVSIWNKNKARGLVILAVSADRGSVDLVRKFRDEYQMTFPVLLDPEGAVRKEYEVEALPVTYLVGRDGKISGRVIGSTKWSGEDVRNVIEDIMSGE